MEQVKVTELSKKINAVITKVEKGGTCLIFKKGKPIAEIVPLKSQTKGWKKTISKAKLPSGISAETYIEEERNL